MRGRKPRPGSNPDAPIPPDALPRCPAQLSPVAAKEWRRLAKPLHDMGVLSTTDRAALAAYCQTWARWVDAEERLKETPMLIKAPSGYPQQSPWLAIANKQLELMNRYMSDLGLTPVARTRLPPSQGPSAAFKPVTVEFVTVYEDREGRDGDGAEAPDEVLRNSTPAAKLM